MFIFLWRWITLNIYAKAKHSFKKSVKKQNWRWERDSGKRRKNWVEKNRERERDGECDWWIFNGEYIVKFEINKGGLKREMVIKI